MIAEHQRPIVSGFNAKSESSDVLNGVNLQNKVIIVTGGYSGIGIETTRSLALAGAEVIIPAKRVDVAANSLSGIVSKENIYQMDLGDLNSVKSFTDKFKNKFSKLNILINNAGIMACPETRVGKNWESQFAINHIGHFLLTKELMNVMADTEGSRFVSLSSSAHA